MATLTNTQISVTYVGLLKTSANTVLSSTAQQITDGSGNNSILFLSTAGVGIGGAAASGKELDVTGNVQITGDLIVDNIKIDGNTISAESGVVTLANGAIATTQSQNDNSTKIATTAYVDAAIDGVDTLAEILANGNTTGGNNIVFGDSATIGTDDTLIFGAGNDLRIAHNGTDSVIRNFTGDLFIDQEVNDGDIIFRSDNGSGDKATYYFLDGSTVMNRFVQHVQLDDNIELRLGTNQDLRIEHTGSDGTITNFTGSLTIQNNTDNSDIIFKSDNGSGGTTAYLTLDGSTEKNVFSKDAFFGDNVKALFGAGSDLEIFHDTGNSIIKDNGTGDLYLMASSAVRITNIGASEHYAKFIENGAVELYHDNSKKFETTSTGANITDDEFNLGDGAYQKVLFDTSPSSVIGTGTMEIQPTTAPGSGTANFTTYFKSKVASGTTNHNIKVDGSATFGSDITTSGKFISTSSSSGDYVRLYAGSGTAQWDIYGSGENLRLSENSSGGGIFQVDSGATFGSDIITSGHIFIPVAKNLYFGGGSHTYIGEDIDDRLRFFVGGAEFMRFTEDTSDTIQLFQDTTLTGLITATKTQDAQSLFSFKNLSTGTSATSRVVAEADGGSVQLVAGGSNYSAISGAWQDAGVVTTSSMSGGLILASDNGVAINANGGTRALTISASDQSATFAGQIEVSKASNQIKLSTGTSGDGHLNIGHFSNGTFIGTYGDDGGAADLIRFGTHSGDERMRITSGGNVGISQTNPIVNINSGSFFKPDSSGRFVTLNSANGSFVMLETSTTTDNDNAGGVYFTNTAGQSDAHKQIAGISCTYVKNTSNNALSGGQLEFFTKPNNAGSNTPRFTIGQTGEVSVVSALEGGQTLFNTKNANVATPAEQFYVEHNGADVAIGNKRGAFAIENDLDIGVADGGERKLKIHGSASGSPEGGQIELHTAADHDSTYAFYRIDAYEDDLRIGRAGTTDITLQSTGNVLFGGNITLNTATLSGALFTEFIKSNSSVRIDIDNDNNQTDRAFLVSKHNAGTELMRVNEDGNVGITQTSPVGKIHTFSTSTNDAAGYGGNNFGIIVSQDNGNNAGDEGNGIVFTQQYAADGVDAGQVRTGAIIGHKVSATGSFGGGLKFKVQPAGANPLSTALTLSNNNSATFAGNVTVNGGQILTPGGVNLALNPNTGLVTVGGAATINGTLSITADGSNAVTFTESGNGLMTVAVPDDFVVDAEGDISFDANGGDIRLKDGGTQWGALYTGGGGTHFYIESIQQDKDIIFVGNDGGSTITALTLDMSNGGSATFAGSITIGGGHSFANDGNGDLEISSGPSDAMNIISNDTMSLRTGGNNQRMFIDNNGDVLVGGSGTANIYLGNLISSSSSNRGMRLHTNNADFFFDFQGDAVNQLFFRDYDGSGGIHTRHEFRIDNGSITIAGTLTQNGSPSDIKYKENIKTILNGIDKIEKLNPVEFDWNDKSDAHKIGKKEDAGFIAQEVQKVLPNLVNENVDGDLALNYEGIIPYLVQSIQELKKEIEILKSK